MGTQNIHKKMMKGLFGLQQKKRSKETYKTEGKKIDNTLKISTQINVYEYKLISESASLFVKY